MGAVAEQSDLFITVSKLANSSIKTPHVTVTIPENIPSTSTADATGSTKETPLPDLGTNNAKKADMLIEKEEKTVDLAQQRFRKWDKKPLRDPFWPIGYFPENWQTERDKKNAPNLGADWTAPAKLIRVNGTSRMGDQTAVIVNDEVKSIGDLIEIHYGDRIYQWKILNIQPTGKIQLERFSVKSAGSSFQIKISEIKGEK
jgi:hypothetical protein